MGYRNHALGGLSSPTLAARHWVVSFDELLAAGLSARQIEERVAGGLLHRLHRGVYAVGRRSVSFEGACRAAVLACGPGAGLSHGPAMRIWRFGTWNGVLHVSGPRSLRGHPGLIVHRPRSLAPDDLATRNGVHVTTVARTLLDLSAINSVDQVGRWIHEAGVQGVFNQREAWTVLERHPRHRGRKNLEAALALEVLPTRSGLEEAFLVIIRRAGLPIPLVNSDQWSGEKEEEVDFCWPDLGLIVETDGDRYHASRWRQRRDAAKDERFRAQGWVVWRVPELAITLDPGGTATLLASLGRRQPRNTGLRQPNVSA